MKTIILAGGFGTRLREAVGDVPKPMAMVAGRPFLEYLLDRLISCGINDIVLSVGYKADLIIQHFSNLYGNPKITFAVEEEPLGTGGAIARVLSGEKQAALVLNGDTFVDLDYAQLINWHRQRRTAVTMVLKRVREISRYGSVIVSNEQVAGFIEKGKSGPGLINAGVYILQPDIFETFGMTGRFSLETDLLQRHCDALSPRAYLTDAYFIDIGLPEDYERAQSELPTIAACMPLHL